MTWDGKERRGRRNRRVRKALIVSRMVDSARRESEAINEECKDHRISDRRGHKPRKTAEELAEFSFNYSHGSSLTWDKLGEGKIERIEKAKAQLNFLYGDIHD